MSRNLKFGSIFVSLFLSTQIFADEVIIAADVWCPVNCTPRDPKTNAAPPEGEGFMVDFARYALEKAGHTVTYRIIPWTRVLQDVGKGDLDGAIGAYKEEAKGFVFPAEEQSELSETFFVRKGFSWTYKGISSLQKISLGVIQDYSYADEINDYIKTHDKDEKKIQFGKGEKPLEKNIQKLKSSRIDAVIESNVVFQNAVATNPEFKDLFVSAGDTKKNFAYIAFSPAPSKAQKSATYAKLLGDAMVAMRKDGTLAKILSRYNLKDWK